MSDLLNDGTWTDFLLTHTALHRAVGLPAIESAEGDTLYGAWRRRLVAHRVTSADVLEASERLLERRGVFPSEHFAALLSIAERIREDRLMTERRWRPRPVDAREADWRREWNRLRRRDREARIDRARKRFPAFDRFPSFLEQLAIFELGRELEEVAHAHA